MKPQPPAITRMWGWWPLGDWGPFTFYTSHKRRRVVAFLKAPPQQGPSWKQELSKARFRNAANLWSMLPADQRAAWTKAGKRARLSISGYNFFMHVHLTHNFDAARTVQRQSGVDLGV